MATYSVAAIDYIPWKDYQVGDWVAAPDEQMIKTKRRIVSISVSERDNGRPNYALEFDTIYQENQYRLDRILSSNGMGGAGGTSYNTVPNGSNPGGKPVVILPTDPESPRPLSPTNVQVNAVGDWDQNGLNLIAIATVSWTPVTLDVDNNEIAPYGYEVWAQGDTDETNTWRVYATTTDTEATIQPLQGGTTWNFKVRTLLTEEARVVSDFTEPVSLKMPSSTDPLDAPTKPTLTSSMGLLKIHWDGLLTSGEPPLQFRYTFALVSPAGANNWTQMGTALSRGGGDIVISGLTVGSNYDVRLVAVDGVGVSSQPGAIATGAVIGVDTGDLSQEVQDILKSVEGTSEAAAAAVSAGNLILNGGFELPVIDGDPIPFWDEKPGTSIVSTPTTDASSLQALKWTDPSTSGATIAVSESALPVSPGDSLRVAWSYAIQGASVINSYVLGISPHADGSNWVPIMKNEATPAGATDYITDQMIWTSPEDWPTTSGFLVLVNQVAVNGRVTYFDSLRADRAIDGSLVVNGALDGIEVNSMVLNSPLIQTSAEPNTGLKVTPAGIVAYDAEGNPTITIGADGTITTAEAVLNGGALALESIEANRINLGTLITSLISSELGSQLDLTSNEQVNIIVGQTNANAQAIADTNTNLNEMQTYYQFEEDGVTISSPGSPFSVVITNSQLQIWQNGSLVSYWDSGSMVVESFVGSIVKLARHQLQPTPDGTGTVVRSI